jgi:hypothetical protein
METNINSNVRVAKDFKIQLDRFDGTNYTR